MAVDTCMMVEEEKYYGAVDLIRVSVAGGRWSTSFDLKSSDPKDEDSPGHQLYSQLIRLNSNLFSGCDIHYLSRSLVRVHYPSGDFPIRVCVIDLDRQNRSRRVYAEANTMLGSILKGGELLVGSILCNKVKYYGEGVSNISSYLDFLDIGLTYNDHVDFILYGEYIANLFYTLFIVSDDWLTRPKTVYHYFAHGEEQPVIYANSYQSPWVLSLQLSVRDESETRIKRRNLNDGSMNDISYDQSIEENRLYPSVPFSVSRKPK